ncbi:MAG: SUMF1/EgtB/PvdO family nonheme iron enzyme [Planctomycetota bacterium]
MQRRLTAALACLIATTAQAQVDIDFVTIGAPGNEPFEFDTSLGTIQWGEVEYRYRIGRTEITTQQWMTFLNTFATQDALWEDIVLPFAWGAVDDPGYNGPGRRWMLNPNNPDAALVPVDMGWFDAARFANWMHNGQSSDPASLNSGVYDASLFNLFDAPLITRAADAKYWIPSIDEWIKAAHYDPNRFGPGEGGYWQWANMSDEPPIPGLPGTGGTTAATLDDVRGLPIGSYPEALSPWGLLDTSGSRREWTDEIDPLRFFLPGDPAWQTEGSGAGFSGSLSLQGDEIDRGGNARPFSSPGISIRLAAAIPTPSTATLATLAMIAAARRRR